MRFAKVSVWFLAMFVTVPAAQTPAPPDFVAPQAGETILPPKVGCEALRALTGHDFTIETTAVVPASAGVPEYCLVKGQILPEIRFEVTLPARWNRRFLMTGNGGFAGESLDAPSRANPRSLAARRGFVLAMSNTGHDAATEPLGSFAVNRQKLLDFAFRSLPVTADAGKKIAASFYGAAPSKSYFEGCSTGGRQGLILAQRFPELFDGIVAGAPVLAHTGTLVKFLQRERAMAVAPVPPAKVEALASRIYGLCDDKDGLKDGLIDDPRRCDFRPSRDLPACPAGANSNECFTNSEITTLEAIYGELVVNGTRVYPAWPVGGEVAGATGRSGWDGWIVQDNAQPPSGRSFSESFFRFLAFPEKNPTLDLLSLDLENTLPRLDWITQVMDATDPDLTAFRRRGGKLFMYFGWAEPALNPMMGVEYYENVLARMGPTTPSFFRLFMVPGMFHCAGGVGCSTFDKLLRTVEWVEKGTAPDRIVASRVVNGKTLRTRPLCPYPQIAVYRGQGSIDEESSFTCQPTPAQGGS